MPLKEKGNIMYKMVYYIIINASKIKKTINKHYCSVHGSINSAYCGKCGLPALTRELNSIDFPEIHEVIVDEVILSKICFVRSHSSYIRKMIIVSKEYKTFADSVEDAPNIDLDDFKEYIEAENTKLADVIEYLDSIYCNYDLNCGFVEF